MSADVQIKVGDKLYAYTHNVPHGATYRDRWVGREIVGENRSSWVLTGMRGHEIKVDKKTLAERARHAAAPFHWITAARVEIEVWRQEHLPRLRRALDETRDIDKLRQIDAILSETPT